MRHQTSALRLFRSLLWLYPAEFRDHFGHEICIVAADRLRERPGIAEILSMYLGVFVDAPKEHYYMIRHDIVYSIRTMRKQKLATVASIVVLALGIGSTTTVFTLVNGIMLRPLPYPDQERLVYVEEAQGGSGLSGAIAYPNFLDFCSRNRSLQDFAMFGSGLTTLRGDMEAERVPAASGTEALFRVLGTRPMMGRTFTAEEDRPDAAPVAVLSEDLWRRRYGADPQILTKTIVIGSANARVIGVMPHGFHFPDTAELWTPLQLDLKNNTRTDHGLEGIARLRGGVTVGQAQEDLRAIMAQISREHPTETYGQTVNVLPYRARDTRQVRPLLITLLGAVAFVLLMACANITNLLLVKASGRTREIAVRGALGASRSRLIRQFVVESVLLGIAGASAGVLFSVVAIPALLSLVPQQLPSWIQFTPDGRMLGFVVAITVGTALLVSAIPALSASRLNLLDTLKEGGRTSTSGGANAHLRSALVIAEVAMSVLLLVGAGLMIQTFRKLNGQNAGFRTENITTLQTAAPSSRYPNGPAAVHLVRRIRQEFASLLGVISVAGSTAVPLLDSWGRSFTVDGRPVLGLKETPLVNHVVVTPGYFKTLGIPILEGRDFEDSDAKNPMVTIIDAALAKRYWPNESALGKRVRYGPPENNEPWHTVVGVVGEARNQTLREMRRNSVYLPHGEFGFASLAYLVRTNDGLADPGKILRARTAGVDRAVAVSRVLTLRDVVTRSIWQERFFTAIFTFFGALALVLAGVGLYGVMAYAVSRRTHEMGIRMALGASASEIQGMIWRQSGRLVGIGLALGSIAAAFLTKMLKSELYDVSPNDPATFVSVAALLLLASVLACYLPAHRATRVDTILALREE